jgi:hypothetical protein
MRAAYAAGAWPFWLYVVCPRLSPWCLCADRTLGAHRAFLSSLGGVECPQAWHGRALQGCAGRDAAARRRPGVDGIATLRETSRGGAPQASHGSAALATEGRSKARLRRVVTEATLPLASIADTAAPVLPTRRHQRQSANTKI